MFCTFLLSGILSNKVYYKVVDVFWYPLAIDYKVLGVKNDNFLCFITIVTQKFTISSKDNASSVA